MSRSASGSSARTSRPSPSGSPARRSRARATGSGQRSPRTSISIGGPTPTSLHGAIQSHRMPTVSRNAPGTFCWVELYTTDQAGAKSFYGSLFGWGVRDIPMGPGAVYTIFTLEGRSAAACYGALPEMEARGITPHWLPYVAVAHCDETAAKVKAAGGTVLKEPFDVPSTGRMAALADPGGAAFCIWQEKGQPGIGVHREPGALHWVELLASDTE